MDREIIEGEHTAKEIARRTGHSYNAIRGARYQLKKRGYITTLGNYATPPSRIARTLYRYLVLKELSKGRQFPFRQVAGSWEVSVNTLNSWFTPNPDIINQIQSLAGGRYWGKAKEDLKEWLEEQERFFGKKYEGKEEGKPGTRRKAPGKGL
ncbi:MAG: hypothetical protein NT067_01805 [Candidatus Diapherotrites archaeon]|nr:hypothetical protein [Candidatus Diapherotrites archaeon]